MTTASDDLPSPPRQWQHHTIAEVRYDPRWMGWRVRDDAGSDWLWFGEHSGVTPRVGDAISFCGIYASPMTTCGGVTFRLVIGEHVVWNAPFGAHGDAPPAE